MRSDQHLSDEAVAAFADKALGRAAAERARRHTAGCAECAAAVAEQREAVWALRAAAPPSMPSSLIDRLRAVPVSTPLSGLPAGLDERGQVTFPAFGAAAFTAPARPVAPGPPTTTADDGGAGGDGGGGSRQETRAHRMRPLVVTAAAAAAAGAITASALVLGSGSSSSVSPRRLSPGLVHTVRHLGPADPALFGRPR